MKGQEIVIRLALLVTIGGSAVACRPGPGGWPRLVQSPSTPYLGSEVDKALDAVREGRAGLPADAATARDALDETHVALSRVKAFYLPILEATRRAYNAHQFAALGETAKAHRELDRIETILETVAEVGEQGVARAMEEPLELLGDARAALISASPEASHHLEWLAERLELILMKGDLVLD